MLRGRDQICEAPGRRVSEKVEGSTTTERYHQNYVAARRSANKLVLMVAG